MQSDLLLFPGDLNSVEGCRDFDPAAPSLVITSKGSLHKGGLYLRAALKEMHEILRLCEEMEKNHEELLRQVKTQYDYLNHRKMQLEFMEQRRSIFKPFDLVTLKRGKKDFLQNALRLWHSTRTTSDTLRRVVLSVPSADVDPVESDSLGGNEPLVGLVTPLPSPEEMNAPGTQEAIAAAQRVAHILASHGNPFADPNHSENQDAQSSAGSQACDSQVLSPTQSSISTSPSSPGSASSYNYVSLNLNYNVVNTRSTNPGFTINNSSSGSSGSTLGRYSLTNSPSS